jgi:hypothetical protein
MRIKKKKKKKMASEDITQGPKRECVLNLSHIPEFRSRLLVLFPTAQPLEWNFLCI